MKRTVYSTYEIGKICGVTMQTVIEWEKKGKIIAFKTLGGHRRILEADLLDFLKTNKIPIPVKLANKYIKK